MSNWFEILKLEIQNMTAGDCIDLAPKTPVNPQTEQIIATITDETTKKIYALHQRYMITCDELYQDFKNTTDQKTKEDLGLRIAILEGRIKTLYQLLSATVNELCTGWGYNSIGLRMGWQVITKIQPPSPQAAPQDTIGIIIRRIFGI